jgi:hypothetical protein
MEKSKNYRLKFVKYIKREHVDYIIRLICLEDDKINVEFLERYSAFKDLHEVFKKEANSINFPKFPPKKFFGNTDEKFLNQRQTALEHYFNTILGSKEFSSLPSLRRWIDTLILKYNKVSTNAPIAKITEDKPITSNVSRQTMPSDTNQQSSAAPKNGNYYLDNLLLDIQKWKETVDKFSKNFIDLGNDNNPHYEPEDCYVRERNYKNVLKNNGVFNNLNSKLFKIDPGNNSYYEYLGLEESNLVKFDNIMLGKLNQMYKTINSYIPEEYIVEDLITKINVSRR